MKRLFVSCLALTTLLGCIERVEKKPDTIDQKQVAAACEQIIADYQASLKRELMTAMAEGGLENALSVCNVTAPAVADSFGAMPGLDIRRVSLKQRNPHFSPDDLETAILEIFNATGSTEPMVHSELVIDSVGVERFRYMKEIKVGQLCLKCHGNPEGFSEGMKQALAERYPADKAVGYSAGDSRGAFSVTLTYPEAKATVTELLRENGR